jgi:carboxyl-terminal processing protease
MPEPGKETPRQTTNRDKPPKAATKEKPPPIDKEEAIAFALDVLSATGTLAEKYHRELDEDRLIVWAIRGLFEAAKVPRPPALERMMWKKSPEGVDRLDLLIAAREMLGKRKGFAAPKDADAALQRIFRRLDPHTTLLDEDTMTRLSMIQNGDRVGEPGLVVRRQPGSDTALVVTTHKDGPAYQAGIRGGDVITRVRLLDGPDGEALQNPEDVSPATLAEENGRASWGPVGSRVEVTVRQPGDASTRLHTLTRARVKKEKVLGFKRRADDSWDHLVDPAQGIYYVRLSDFHGPKTAGELDRLLQGFEQAKMKGLVLDLRFSGSGLIQTAFAVADLFVAGGLIVEFRSRNLQNGRGRWMSRGKGKHTRFPMVCLVNQETGTCTDIVASALQDHHRARIVGERTSGKASAQNYFPTGRGTLRITTSYAYRPNGKPLDRAMAPDITFERGVLAGLLSEKSSESDEWGVTPDNGCVVKLSAAARDALRERFLAAARLSRQEKPARKERAFRDRQLEKALECLRGGME